MKFYQMIVTLKDGTVYKGVPMKEGDDAGEGQIANDQLWDTIRETMKSMFKTQERDDVGAHLNITFKDENGEKEEMICNFRRVRTITLRSWEG